MKNMTFSFAALFILFVSVVRIEAQTPAKNKALVLKAYKEINDQDNNSSIHNGYIPYWPEGWFSGNPKTIFSHYFAAIPNAKFTVEQATAEGNTVTIHLHTTGTFKNKFMDWEATGKPFSYRSTQTLTFDSKGQITDGFLLPDPALFLR